jgi:two-component system, OmpR family, sensor histidine kinase SenX3
MKAGSRVRMFAVAAALLGLIALLATLQYRWLGQVSAAERERMKTSLAARANGFAQDFDREITRAYLMFQLDPIGDGSNLATHVAERHDRWQATARYPKLVKDIYVVTGDSVEPPALQRFNAATRFVEPADWPAPLEPIRAHLSASMSGSARQGATPPGASTSTVVVRTIPTALWESVPALLVPAPVMIFSSPLAVESRPDIRPDLRLAPSMSSVILVLDREYMSGEMLPALAQQHFRGTAEGIDYEMAVVRTAEKSAVYSSATGFAPDPASASDATADMFQVRLQEFGAMVSEVRRFTSFVSSRVDQTRDRRDDVARRIGIRQAPLSIVLQHSGPATSGAAEKRAIESGLVTAAQRAAGSAPKWRLLVKHPSGSLEAAVANVRRRNLLVSSGILAILGVSIGFLVVSTRRAQDLARQQMEFVAAVSHELRTPLAVIRSAADNLADGVVHEDSQVRKYGELVRGEGRRLTEMVEQILELAGIHSGQRGFALGPVPVAPLLRQVVEASAPLVEEAGLKVDYDLPQSLPPILGDEQALRRVFQNLVGNAIKYGASGGWIGLRARASGREVLVTVADRGIGIEAFEQPRIFEPFYRAPGVIEAQIHGAGLGLSLVQRIVEAHGGRITLRSAPGTGSEFTVHLPAASEETVARTSSAPDPAPTFHHS